jgi:muconate cycloisomerase
MKEDFWQPKNSATLATSATSPARPSALRKPAATRMWNPSDLIRALPRVHEIGLAMPEQPLPPAAAAFQRELVGALRVDIAADEAARTVADAAAVVADRSTTVLNTGHSKLGSPTAALRAAQIAHANGVGGNGRHCDQDGHRHGDRPAPHRHAPQAPLPVVSDGPLMYRHQITEQQVEVVDGCVAVPAGPGIGFTVDERELRRLDARGRP